MKFIYILSIISTLGLFGSLQAQNPAPGKKSNQPILIKNAEMHIGNGKVMQGDLLIENQLIKAIGANLPVPAGNISTIDATGKRVYPGFISPNSTLGLIEVAAVRTSVDDEELGQMTPSVRAQIAHNTDSEVIPTVRGNGVLIGQTTPSGKLVSGRSGIMNYDGWNWEDALLKGEDGLWITWPNFKSRRYDFEAGKRVEEENKNYQRDIDLLKKLFQDGRAYANEKNPTSTNQNLAAVAALWSGDMRLFIRASDPKQMIAAITFAEEMNIKYPVLVGGEGSLEILDILKSKKVPILLSTTHRLPDATDDDVWEPYKLPGLLVNAGLQVGLFYNESFWRTRNLPFVAGTAAAHGLDKEKALSLITLSNAQILGIDKMVGSLEVGKQATLFISKGDALDMNTSKVERAFIKGMEVDLDDKQKRLSEKYFEKYDLKK